MLSGAPTSSRTATSTSPTIAASDLTWTIIRVPLMTQHYRANQYTIRQEAPHPVATTAYRDAARAMLDLATGDNPAWTRSAPFVTSEDPSGPAEGQQPRR